MPREISRHQIDSEIELGFMLVAIAEGAYRHEHGKFGDNARLKAEEICSEIKQRAADLGEDDKDPILARLQQLCSEIQRLSSRTQGRSSTDERSKAASKISP